jgi:hypothetical protein
VEESQKSDVTKNSLCKNNGRINILVTLIQIGITLVEIPFWWKRDFPSFSATIFSHRPDLFSEKPIGTPIPTIKPTSDQKQKSEAESK